MNSSLSNEVYVKSSLTIEIFFTDDFHEIAFKWKLLYLRTLNWKYLGRTMNVYVIVLNSCF